MIRQNWGLPCQVFIQSVRSSYLPTRHGKLIAGLKFFLSKCVVFVTSYPSIHPFIHAPTRPSVHPSTHPSVRPSTYLPIYGSAALVDLGRFFSFLIYTQSVGLLRRGISPSQGRYLHTKQHTRRINAHRHPCLEWDSNSRSQCSSGRRRVMP
jgi:hypothetical protein